MRSALYHVLQIEARIIFALSLFIISALSAAAAAPMTGRSLLRRFLQPNATFQLPTVHLSAAPVEPAHGQGHH